MIVTAHSFHKRAVKWIHNNQSPPSFKLAAHTKGLGFPWAKVSCVPQVSSLQFPLNLLPSISPWGAFSISFIDLYFIPARFVLPFPMVDSVTHTSPPPSSNSSPSFYSLFGTSPPSHPDRNAMDHDDDELSPTQPYSLPGSVLDGTGAVSPRLRGCIAGPFLLVDTLEVSLP